MDGLFQFEDLDSWAINNDDMYNPNLASSGATIPEIMDIECLDNFLLEESFSLSQELSYSYEPSSSLSSKSSGHSDNQILITRSVSSSIKAPLFEPYNPNLTSKFSNLNSDEDAIITKAMVSIISSVSLSSPPLISQNLENQVNKKGQFNAFRPFKSFITPKYEVNFENDGQKMIKKSLSMLRSIKSSQAKEIKPTNLHHMISERKRREKLNESFETLRMLLPPGSKKDKTSVLMNSTNYVKTLEGQISDLKKKNRKLEAYLPNFEEINDPIIGTNRRAQVQISKTRVPKSEILQISLKITVMTECDIIDLVLSILEFLKLMKAVSLVSVDTYTFSPQMNLYAKASIKLLIKDSDWSETLFQEAMRKAVDEATSELKNIL